MYRDLRKKRKLLIGVAFQNFWDILELVKTQTSKTSNEQWSTILSSSNLHQPAELKWNTANLKSENYHRSIELKKTKRKSTTGFFFRPYPWKVCPKVHKKKLQNRPTFVGSSFPCKYINFRKDLVANQFGFINIDFLSSDLRFFLPGFT